MWILQSLKTIINVVKWLWEKVRDFCQKIIKKSRDFYQTMMEKTQISSIMEKIAKIAEQLQKKITNFVKQTWIKSLILSNNHLKKSLIMSNNHGKRSWISWNYREKRSWIFVTWLQKKITNFDKHVHYMLNPSSVPVQTPINISLFFILVKFPFIKIILALLYGLSISCP